MPKGVYDRSKSKPNRSFFKKGHKTWNKGKELSENTRERMRLNHADFSGSNHPNWKGGRKMHRGYVYIRVPEHPCQSQGYVREHRVVVEKIIGRYLSPREEVHHLGKKSDNRPHKLMAFVNSAAHKRFELFGKIKPEETIFDGRKIETTRA